jgi:hypothetical protein
VQPLSQIQPFIVQRNQKQKCIKCATSHPESACPKKEYEAPVCANCNENHPANYKGCSYRKSLLKIKQQKEVNSRRSHQRTIPEFNLHHESFPQLNGITSHGSFSQPSTSNFSKVVRNENNSQNISNEFSQLNSEIVKLFNFSLSEFSQKIKKKSL